MADVTSALKQGQAQVQVQKIAPQMRQSLAMLAKSLPELRAELYREMATNPVIDDIEPTLERETVSHKERETADEERSFDSDYTEDDDIPGSAYTADADALERRRRFFDSRTREETLEEHLMAQLATSGIDDGDLPLAETLVGELNDDGYFAGAMPDLIMVSGESETKIREVLSKIMALDPPGCGATSLEECLLAQIDKLDGSPYQQEVRELIERHHLGDIAEGRVDAIKADLAISGERYEDVLAALRTLDPRPAREYSRAGRGVAFVNPEVHAVKDGDRWLARVDERSLPEIHISGRYLKMLEDPSVDAEAKAYIRAKIASANGLVEAVRRREATVTSIAQAIFDAQPGFFAKGLKGLRPLTMQEIADKVGVHHTTVSRTVHDKYASTPRGTVELRKFFTAGLVTESGVEVSKADAVDALKRLIDGEDKTRPLSDESLSGLLKAAGYPIARRTVAKYRTRLGIPGAVERAAAGRRGAPPPDLRAVGATAFPG